MLGSQSDWQRVNSRKVLGLDLMASRMIVAAVSLSLPITMPTIKQVKRRQNIQMAEGYLDLATVLDERWPLDFAHRRAMSEQALANLEKIENPLGHKPYVLFLKGQAWKVAARYQDAIRYFKQSLKLDPDNEHTYLALAWCYKREGRVDLAVDTITCAVELNPESAIAQYNFACYLALDRQVERAIMHLSFALDLNSEYQSMVADEPDFDSIRLNPGFASLATTA